MRFVWAFLIILTSLIPFLIGAGYGLNTLLGYCSSDSNCHRYEVCETSKCTDPCAQMLCNDNKYCNIINRTATCTCQPGFSLNRISKKCEPKIYCTTEADCDSSSKCQNKMCINVCHDVNCGQSGTCQVNKTTGGIMCVCQSKYMRHPKNSKCVKRCLGDRDCDATEACYNKKWCDTPCVGTNLPHAHCVPQNHKPTYHCNRCYRPDKSGNKCERVIGDDSCQSLNEENHLIKDKLH